MPLQGELVTLRTIEREDVETLHGFDAAYETWPELNYTPYAPKSLDEVLKADPEHPDAKALGDEWKK